MQQRLDARGTLESTVAQLALGRFDPLLSQCKRTQEGNIGLGTGGYCQARQNLPKMLMDRAVEEIVQRLRNHLGERLPQWDRPVYVIDGSSLQLEPAAELSRAYPPARNPRRPSHWPVLRFVVLHDVMTGLAQVPCWGPMYGPEAVSEQALAERAMSSLPPGAVLIMDRNFGIFAMAHSAHQKGQDVVVRMTKQRAKCLVGEQISRSGAYTVEWKPSDRERKKYGLRPNDVIQGRWIAWRIGRGKSKQWLYLFTTLLLAPEEVVEMYGKRWYIETDLRSLKQTVRLNHLSVRFGGHNGKRVAGRSLGLQPGPRRDVSGRSESRHPQSATQLHLCLQSCAGWHSGRFWLDQRWPYRSKGWIVSWTWWRDANSQSAPNGALIPGRFGAGAGHSHPERRKLSDIGLPTCGRLPIGLRGLLDGILIV